MIGGGRIVDNRQFTSDGNGGGDGGRVLQEDLPEGGGGLVFILVCCSTAFCSKQDRMPRVLVGKEYEGKRWRS